VKHVINSYIMFGIVGRLELGSVSSKTLLD